MSTAEKREMGTEEGDSSLHGDTFFWSLAGLLPVRGGMASAFTINRAGRWHEVARAYI